MANVKASLMVVHNSQLEYMSESTVKVLGTVKQPSAKDLKIEILKIWF
jgi:hypothetical protein